VFRPTADTRAAILKHIGEVAEQAKQQVRIARTDALKSIRHKSGKNSTWGKEVSLAAFHILLTFKYIADDSHLTGSTAN
jgi:ribosome recycling factor